MPSVIHMIGLAVVAAVTVGTLVVYYALNGNGVEELRFEDARRRRRRSNELQLPIRERQIQAIRERRRGSNEQQLPVQDRPDEANLQNNRNPDNPCGLCNQNIVNTEYDLTSLPCSHNFHCRCICDHLHRTGTAANDTHQSTCPVCGVAYTIEDIFEP